MSFLSQHIAKQNNTHDPVVGPDSPHHHHSNTQGKAHYQGHPETSPARVIHDGQRETAYEHQEYPKMLHKDGDTKIVQNESEHQDAFANGWTETAAKE